MRIFVLFLMLKGISHISMINSQPGIKKDIELAYRIICTLKQGNVSADDPQKRDPQKRQNTDKHTTVDLRIKQVLGHLGLNKTMPPI